MYESESQITRSPAPLRHACAPKDTHSAMRLGPLPRSKMQLLKRHADINGERETRRETRTAKVIMYTKKGPEPKSASKKQQGGCESLQKENNVRSKKKRRAAQRKEEEKPESEQHSDPVPSSWHSIHSINIVKSFRDDMS